MIFYLIGVLFSTLMALFLTYVFWPKEKTNYGWKFYTIMVFDIILTIAMSWFSFGLMCLLVYKLNQKVDNRKLYENENK